MKNSAHWGQSVRPFEDMKNKEVARRFVDAVNAYIEMHNEKMKRLGEILN
jgi:hypothetical protein